MKFPYDHLIATSPEKYKRMWQKYGNPSKARKENVSPERKEEKPLNLSAYSGAVINNLSPREIDNSLDNNLPLSPAPAAKSSVG